ncbi:MAG TPA: glycosyltransferase [Solirubrobacteraceae bacterium]
MKVTPILNREQLGLARGAAVICVPVGAADARTLVTLRSILKHSESSIPVICAGSPASLEPIAEELAGDRNGSTLLSLAVDRDTEVAAVNAAMALSFPSDFVLVSPGVRLGAHWSERLRAAAMSDSIVASASPLGASDSLDNFEETARRICEQSLRLRPRIATIGPGCTYIRRPALELAGPLDESLGLDEALTQLALRALALGMIHVAADDVLVEGPSAAAVMLGESSVPWAGKSPVQETLDGDERGALRRAVSRARSVLRPLSVTIDARALASTVGGTQTYIIELILALTRQSAVRVRVLVPPDLSERAADAFAMRGVELLSYEQAVAGVALSDVVHRPQQVFTPDDLALLRLVGERLVIGQQDLIAYHNYSYHRDIESWRGYRRTTRLALAGADQVVFFSEHARRDALAEDLLPEGRTRIVGIAAEGLESSSLPAVAPEGLSADGPPFLLCLGADYAHKNRPFAIELLSALRELGWPGRLVFAGPHVPNGSSREAERRLLSENAGLAGHVVDCGSVDESGKRWLYAHTCALVYPTVYEGFGLLPLEAARAGLPCLFAAQASLAEVGGEAATLIEWDAPASAVAVLPLLSEGPARTEHLRRLEALPFPSWEEVAQQLVDTYEQALFAPPSEAAPRIWQELDRESYIASLARDVGRLKQIAQEYQEAYHALERRVSVGLPLIDDGGLLNRAQQRGLMRVAARRGLGPAVLAPFGLLGRLGDHPVDAHR